MKTAFITGASRGIGRACAEKFASEGYSLGLCCKNNIESLNDLKAELEQKYGIECLTFQGDVSDYSFAEKCSKTFLEKFGRIDVLINNAAISTFELTQDISPEEWNEVIGTNLNSVFYFSKVFIPTFIHQQSGSIINVSSMWGRVGASCEVAYSTSKGGINAFTMALAKELAPSIISVNAIAPGVVDTEMNSRLTSKEKEELAEEIPIGRFAAPEEIAEDIFHITQMPYVTGQIIGADGGYI